MCCSFIFTFVIFLLKIWSHLSNSVSKYGLDFIQCHLLLSLNEFNIINEKELKSQTRHNLNNVTKLRKI